MSNVLIYDKVTGNAIAYLLYVNTPDYDKRADVLVNPDTAILITVPLEYVKVAGGVLVEISAAEKAAVDAAKPIPEQSDFEKLSSRMDALEGRIAALEKP